MLLLLDVEMEVVEVEMVAGAARSGVVGWAWNICIGWEAVIIVDNIIYRAHADLEYDLNLNLEI